MNITFNIPNDFDKEYIDALKWKFDGLTGGDNKLVESHLKKCISGLIDEYKKYLVLKDDEDDLSESTAAVSSMMKQAKDLQRVYYDKKNEYEKKKKSLDDTFVPTEI